MTTTRLAAHLGDDPPLHALATRLLGVAERGLPAMYLPQRETFAFTRAAQGRAPGGGPRLRNRGTSLRYTAITVLGARLLPEDRQRAALGGRSAEELAGALLRRLPGVTDLGDAALVTWAAADTGHRGLPAALRRLAELDTGGGPRQTVHAAWVLSALTAARAAADVEKPLAAARRRLLAARIGRGPLFPHATGPGLLPAYRAHIGCFADQTYPVQALARLHACGHDLEALDAADACAARICRLQGDGGQWWWHYDARTGRTVEGYPVYSVHQHAMAPTALFDLAEAGGSDLGSHIRRGLEWMRAPAELTTAGVTEPLVLDEQAVTWRKVYRGDPRKAVRGVRSITSRVRPGARSSLVDRFLPPDTIDRECRPYEFGWMLHAWLAPMPAARPGALG